MPVRHVNPPPARAELLLTALVFLVLALYAGLVTASPDATFAEVFAFFTEYFLAALTVAGIVTIAGLILLLTRLYGVEKPLHALRDMVLGRWRYDRFLFLLAPLFVFPLTLGPFTLFKQRVLPEAGFPWDTFFRDAERLLFFGHDGWEITHAILPSAWASQAMDSIYHTWFLLAVAILIPPSLMASVRTRTTILITYVLVWVVIGSGLAYLFGSAGPCFYTAFIGPDPSFTAMTETLRAQSAEVGQLNSLFLQESLLANFHAGNLVFSGGISAMPSVHVSLTTLFACVLHRFPTPIRLLGISYVLLIWIASVHLGWHYALDGVLGAAVTLAIWKGAWWFTGRVIERAETPALPRP